MPPYSVLENNAELKILLSFCVSSIQLQ